MTKYISGITLLILGLSNWVLWYRQPVFLISSPSPSSPPTPSVTVARTADDIARGILSLQNDLSTSQRQHLQDLIQQGTALRSTLSQLQGQRQELYLQLMDDSTILLEQ